MSSSHFAANMKFLRAKVKKTQSDFGKYIGATRAQVQSYEEGRAKPKPTVELAICSRFGLSRDQLHGSDISKGIAPEKLLTIDERVDRLEVQVETILKILSGNNYGNITGAGKKGDADLRRRPDKTL